MVTGWKCPVLPSLSRRQCPDLDEAFSILRNASFRQTSFASFQHGSAKIVRNFKEGFQEGLQELKCQLEKLPSDLRAAAQHSSQTNSYDSDEDSDEELVVRSASMQKLASSRVRVALASIGIPRSLSGPVDDMVMSLASLHISVPSLANFISGFDAGVVSLAVVQLTDPHLVGTGWLVVSPWDMGLIVSLKLYGAFGGSVLAFYKSSDLSSRDVLLLTAAGTAVTSFISAVAHGRGELLLARGLMGLLEGVSSPAKLDYTTETSKSELRVATMGVRVGMYSMGAVMGSMVGGLLLPVPGGWHFMLGATCLPAVAMTVGMSMLPHSPRWVLRQSGQTLTVRKAQALAALHQLRGPPPHWLFKNGRNESFDKEFLELQDLQSELEAMAKSAMVVNLDDEGSDAKANADMSLGTFLRNPVTQTTLWVMFFKQACGSVAIFHYKAPVLAALGLSDHLAVLTVLMMGIRAMSSPCGVVLAGHLGFRGALLLGSFGSTISMAGLGICQFLSPVAPICAGVSALTCLATNMVCFEISFGTVSHQLPAELYPKHLRQRGLAWSHVCNYPLKAASVQIFPLLISLVGPLPTWSLLSCASAASFVVMFRLVPETKGKSLEDIEKLTSSESWNPSIAQAG